MKPKTASQISKQQAILATRCREMDKANLFVLKQATEHPDPMYRYAAARSIGRRSLPLEANLIGLLNDDENFVAQMARASLVKLSRGKDFGPLPNCNCDQLQESITEWHQWLSLKKALTP